MRTPSAFFSEIQVKAHKRWEQLEADPELAGPWRQLFSQVQSPRHVLSELLQNADDAGAESASARIVDGVFIFEHDGEDFQPEHFASLCRFGFSNKRTLHTIGFRGIGFKSTFSLGRKVEVITPTIAISFEKERFTEPIWMDDAPESAVTSIRVRIEDSSRTLELEKNLEEWSRSPASLLFFQNIRKLTISGTTLERQRNGKGPVSHSERVVLIGQTSQDVLIIRSDDEDFPSEAVEEIRRERITGDEDFSLPPCKVEVVVGLTGNQRLYVILPTDVYISLPFSCNAPFVQDPARTGIKDPSVSPTNRWLLARVGRLVAETIIAWLSDANHPVKVRAQAYDLLPKGSQKTDFADLPSNRIILERFAQTIGKQPILLSSKGKIESFDVCIAPPLFFYTVWTDDQLNRVFGSPTNSVLAHEVSSMMRERLASWGWLNGFSNPDVITRLCNPETLPKPHDWHSLWLLWEYMDTKLHNQLYGKWAKLCLVPVEGEDILYPPECTVRPSPDKTILSDDDWNFIRVHLHVMDPDWIIYISESLNDDEKLTKDGPKSENISRILERMGLEKITRVDVIVDRAYKGFLVNGEFPKEHLVRFTHILAALDAGIPKEFVYLTREGKYLPVTDALALDSSGELELILPKNYADSHLLDAVYSSGFSSCKERRWYDWASSTKSGLDQFIGIKKTSKYYYRTKEFQEFLISHDGSIPLEYPYKGTQFVINDYDFEEPVFLFWQNLSKDDPTIWSKVVHHLTGDSNAAWKKMMKTTVYQRSSNGHQSPVDCGEIKSHWIVRLRNYPCLKDTNGNLRQPSELLMRSAETELLMDVELFVHLDLDVESTRSLIKALGVRVTPTSLDTIIQRIAYFSKHEKPPVYEIEKFYRIIDRVLPRCSTEEITRVRDVFAKEPLIYSDQGTWLNSNEIFQNPDPVESPGVALILPQVRHLSLWTRIGIAERPTLDLLLKSLNSLTSGQQLDLSTFKRVRSLITRAPVRVWNDYGHWVSLDRCWIPVSEFSYFTMRTLSKYRDLFPAIKRQTADLQEIDDVTIAQPPFSTLKPLISALTYQITDKPDHLSKPKTGSWIHVLGREFRRIKLDNADQQMKIRTEAARLEMTAWQPFHDLKISPFIDGIPAGQADSPTVFWDDTTLFVKDVKPVQIILSLCDELERPFAYPSISEAIKICVERDEHFIVDYLNSTFEMEEILHEISTKDPITLPPLPTETNVSVDLFEDFSDEDGSLSIPDVSSDMPDGSSVPDTAIVPDTGIPEIAIMQDSSQYLPENLDQTPRIEPSLMDIYIKRFDYRWVENTKQYVHKDGSWLQHGNGGFTWDMYSSEGEIIHQFWVAKNCLATKGIEINANLYELIKKFPDATTLLLEDIAGDLEILPGEKLLTLVKNEEVILYPAKYRLRRKSEE